MRSTVIALLLCATLTLNGSGQTQSPAQIVKGYDPTDDYMEPEKLALAAMERLKVEGVTGLYAQLIPVSIDPVKQASSVAAEQGLFKFHQRGESLYGKPVGEIELLRSETLGVSSIRYLFVEKFERGAFVWSLTFYRKKEKEWSCPNINITDQFISEFRPMKPDPACKGALELAQEAIDSLKSNNFKSLFDSVLATGKTVITMDRFLIELKITDVYQKVTADLGKFTGEVELVRTESIGRSLVRYVVAQKFEDREVVWKFTFYGAGGTWKWLNVGVGEWHSEFVDR